MPKPLIARFLLAAALAAPLQIFAAGGEPIVPVPLDPKLDQHKVDLGRSLFNDTRLSKDNALACAFCHRVNQGGADGTPHSLGLGGQMTARNAPTIFNVGFNFRQGWEGRNATLERQTETVIKDPRVIGSSLDEILGKLSSDDALQKRFREAYVEGMQPATILDALVTYQRSLTTPNSRFDKYLRGDKTAITAEELRGYTVFKENGCVACHQGVNVGGNMFQVFGVVGDKGAYFNARGKLDKADLGRFNLTGNESDRYLFKVPSLRNIALTAPYFHDGSAQTLNDAVQVMFKYQLGRKPHPGDVESIVKFLHTLTGELDGRPLDTQTKVVTK